MTRGIRTVLQTCACLVCASSLSGLATALTPRFVEAGPWQQLTLAGSIFDENGVRLRVLGPDAATTQPDFEWSTLAWGREGDLHPVGQRALVRASDRVQYHGSGLIEWYRETPEGIEQGFDVPSRYPGAGRLVIAGAHPVDLEIAASADGSEIRIGNRESGESIRCNGLVALDALGRVLPSRFVIDNSLLCIVVDDAQATYPIVIDPLYSTDPQTIIPGYGVCFSTVGDVNGDGFSDFAISDPWNGDAGSDHGRGNVFLGSPTGVATTPWWTTTGYGGGNPGEYWYFGLPTFGGDFNGDGYGDVCFVAGLLSNGIDWFEVYHGGPNGMGDLRTGLPTTARPVSLLPAGIRLRCQRRRHQWRRR